MKEIGLFKYVTIDQPLISSIISISFRLIMINSAANIYQAYIQIDIHEILSTHFAFAPNVTSNGIMNTNINKWIFSRNIMYM